jgi:hypothetical protein
MNVVQAWRSLNAEQKQILVEKRIDASRSVDELLALMKPLAACDTMADKVRTKLGCSFALAIVVTVAAFFVLTNVSFAVAVIGGLALLAIAGTLGFFYFWTKKIDVSNNFREFAVPVLSVFREDFDATRPVHIQVDLSSPTHKSKLQSESAPYKHGVYHKVIDSMYHDPWMAAEAVLVDGTKLSWTVTDSIRERKKTKRNARGKYKTKTKYSKKTNIEVTLGLRKKTYDVAAPAEAELSGDEKRSVVKVERQVRSESLDPVVPRALIDLITDVYRNASLTKKEAGA